MIFVTTGLAIAGLVAMAIPIVIHLLSRERYRVIPWAAMQFLIEAYRRNKRRLRIEQILLVAVRCLILLLLGIALAQPLIESKNVLGESGPRAIHLIMDDGLISGLTNDQGQTALDRQRAVAKELIASLDTNDLVSVITTAHPAQTAVAPATTNHTGVLDLLSAMEPTPAASDIPTSLRLAKEQIEQLQEQTQRHVIYLLSEFRQGATSLEEPISEITSDIADGIQLLAMTPATEPVSNIQIVSIKPIRHMVMPEHGDHNTQVTITLRREGKELPKETTSLQVITDRGQEATEVVARWQKGQQEATVEAMLDLADISSSDIELQASIEHDALELDNHQFTSLRRADTVRVAIIDRQLQSSRPRVDQMQPGHWVHLALLPEGQSPIEVMYIEPTSLDERQLYGVDVLFLVRPDLLTEEGASAVATHVERGGLVVISPPPDADAHVWATQLMAALSLPWTVQLETSQHETPITLATEQPTSTLLALLGPEMESLSRPVQFTQTITVDVPEGSQDVALVFDDGRPALLVGQTPLNFDSSTDQSRPQEDQQTGEQQSYARRGLVVMLATAPDLQWTNLPSKPLLVPLLHETIRQGLGSIHAQHSATVGQRPLLWAGATDIQLPNGRRISTTQDGRVTQAVEEPGLWRVQDSQGVSLGVLAVNVNPLGGRTGTNTPESVQAWLDRGATEATRWSFVDTEDPAAALIELPDRAPIGRTLLFVVLGLLIIETLLSRRFSHAHTRRNVGIRDSAAEDHIAHAIGGGRA